MTYQKLELTWIGKDQRPRLTLKAIAQHVASHGQIPPGADAGIKGSLTAIRRAALRAR